jgi:hypothetical protein
MAAYLDEGSIVPFKTRVNEEIDFLRKCMAIVGFEPTRTLHIIALRRSFTFF